MSNTHSNIIHTIRAAFVILMLIIMASPSLAAKSSEAERFEAFGRQFVETIKAGDMKTFRRLFNKPELARRVLRGITLKKEDKESLLRGMTGNMAQVPATIMDNLSSARLTFVRTHNVNEMPNALIRLDFGEKGLNYMDLELQVNYKGDVQIVDWIDYTRGMRYTDTVKQLIIPVLPQDGTSLEKLFGTNKLTPQEAKDYTRILKLSKAGDIEGWKKHYPLLPKKIRNKRAILITHVLFMSLSGDEDAYADALKQLDKHYGTDPTLALTLFDYYFLTGDLVKAHKAMDLLAGYIGGDAAIDEFHAKIYIIQKKYKEALRHAEMAVKADSAYDDAYYTLMDAGVFAGQYAKTVGAMQKLEAGFGIDFDPALIEALEGYEKFILSKEYLKWKAERAAK